jgi:anti-sigma regulatory factor (Ser/Thr protein kinase)
MVTPERAEAGLKPAALRLPRVPASIGLARRHVNRLLSGLLDQTRLEDSVLMASELVTNAIVYSDAGRIELRVVMSDTAARVEVYNERQPWARGPELQPRGLDEAGGWGLFIVEKLSDRWGADVDGTLVWFEVDRPALSATKDADPDQELTREVLRARAARRR